MVHIADEAANLKLEADVNIYNGKASDINNGRVSRMENEVYAPIAEFSSFIGSNHLVWYGEPDTNAQVELMTAINNFCAEVRTNDYTINAL